MDNGWKSALVSADATIEEVVRVIHNARDFRVGLVVTHDQKLIGTVTDGDIRRGIMRNIPLTANVSHIMNQSPYMLHESEDKQRIRNLLENKGLSQIPIVDESKRVVGIETLRHLSKNEILDNRVVIMAGGFGKRLRPLTNDCPKPMLSIGDKPLLEHIISDFMAYGFREFFIAVHYLSEKIQSYFDSGGNWGINIKYISESKPLGTAGCLTEIVQNHGGDKPFFVINGDVFTKVNYTHLLNYHTSHQADITVCMRNYSIEIPYGVINFHDDELLSIDEKPSFNHFVNAGLYVLNPLIFREINIHPPYHMTNLIEWGKKVGKKILVFPIHEYWVDVGHFEDYKEAQQGILYA